VNTYNTEQEGFWAESYAEDYIKKNSEFDFKGGGRMLEKDASSCIRIIFIAGMRL